MADTTALKTQIEPHVQAWLYNQFGVRFRRQTVPLMGNGTAGKHQFAAVSEDGKIVASVKNLSGRTTGKNLPSAKIDSSYAEIYYLSLVNAEKRLLARIMHEGVTVSKSWGGKWIVVRELGWLGKGMSASWLLTVQ